MITLGIDPGLDGAIAAYDGRNVRFWAMPTIIVGSAKKNERLIDCPVLFDLLAGIADAQPTLCAVEDVEGVREQSARAACSFGKAAGYAEMAVIGNRIPIALVSPKTYKTFFRIPSSPERKIRKANARLTAANLLPGARAHFARTSDDANAESALLALYAYRVLCASNPCA